MKILFYSVKDFERPHILAAKKKEMTIQLAEEPLSPKTAIMARGYDCISIFTGDDASEKIIEQLHANGVKYITTRAAGYDNIDVVKANELNIRAANVPEYSPYAIAEHAVGMVLALNRRIIKANEQVQQHNFTVGNLIGFDLHNKTIGIIGTGRIGSIVAKIMHGFGCRLLAYDTNLSVALQQDCNLTYVGLDELCTKSDIITIHTPLNPSTKYLINKDRMAQMKKGVMLINTARGAIINTADLIHFLENGTIGYCGLDVYEKEKGIFFYDHSGEELEDKILTKLLNMPNVLITPHQAFATHDALTNIAETTFYNIDCWVNQKKSKNELQAATDK